jgi:Lrp/AsnC family leucine-responsive transcriptional regulator
MEVTLDKLDLRILAALQRDNLITSQALGDAVGLSPSAVQRRIKRLRDDKVIVRDTAVLDATALGSPLTVIVNVTVDREAKEVVASFRRRALASPYVQQCYYVTGEEDFVLVVTAGSMDEYHEIARSLFLDDPNVRRFRTSVVMQSLKVTLDVPFTGS